MTEKLTDAEREALEAVWRDFKADAFSHGSIAECVSALARAALAAVPRLASAPAGERETALLNEIDYMCRVLERIQSSVPIKDGSWYAGVAMGVRARTGAARAEEVGSGD